MVSLDEVFLPLSLLLSSLVVFPKKGILSLRFSLVLGTRRNNKGPPPFVPQIGNGVRTGGDTILSLFLSYTWERNRFVHRP